jgi:hypothetical protein
VSAVGSGAAARLRDAGGGLLGGARMAARGLGLTWRDAGRGCRAGLRRAAAGDLPGAGRELLLATARALVQAPCDALLMLGGRAISALQTLGGVEPPGRPLTAAEIALLRPIFGDGLDYAAVRLKEGPLGLLGLPRRAFTHGDTIFVPWRWRAEQAASRDALLVHEAVHVWQHQRRGTRYMSEALIAQWLGAGYNFATGLVAGKRWADLNPEQQAEMVERAFAAGAAGAGAGEARCFFVKLTEPRLDHGFAVCAVAAADPSARELAASGYGDYTAVLDEALARLRRGAPPADAGPGA